MYCHSVLSSSLSAQGLFLVFLSTCHLLHYSSNTWQMATRTATYCIVVKGLVAIPVKTGGLEQIKVPKPAAINSTILFLDNLRLVLLKCAL